MFRRTLAVLVPLAALILTACSTREPTPAADGADSPLPEPAASGDPRAVPIVTGGGVPATWDELLDAAALADVVIIGEQHGHPVGLPAAAAFWEDLIPRARAMGRSPALALEFIERDHQSHLDDYLTGVTDEPAFRAFTNRTEGNHPAAHADMVRAARDASLRVHAANAPRRYTTLARTEGFDRLAELHPSQQRLFVIPWTMVQGDYRDRFFDLFREMMAAGPGATGKEAPATPADLDARIEGFYRAQQVWDATMAHSVAHALTTGDRPVVLVVGQFHSDFRGGTVEMLQRLAPEAHILTLSAASRAAWTDEDAGRADYLWLLGD